MPPDVSVMRMPRSPGQGFQKSAYCIIAHPICVTELLMPRAATMEGALLVSSVWVYNVNSVAPPRSMASAPDAIQCALARVKKTAVARPCDVAICGRRLPDDCSVCRLPAVSGHTDSASVPGATGVLADR